MKTKLKKILSITLPLVGLTASVVVAAPMIVSCSNNGGEPEKPQTPSNPVAPDNGLKVVKVSPKYNNRTPLEAYNSKKFIKPVGMEGETVEEWLANHTLISNGLSLTIDSDDIGRYSREINKLVEIKSLQAFVGFNEADKHFVAPNADGTNVKAITDLVEINKNPSDFGNNVGIGNVFKDKLFFNSDFIGDTNHYTGTGAHWTQRQSVFDFIAGNGNPSFQFPSVKFIYKMEVSVKQDYLVVPEINTKFDLTAFKNTFYVASLAHR